MIDLFESEFNVSLSFVIIEQAQPPVIQGISVTHEHQMVLEELPVITKLRDTLDSDKSIIKNHAALPAEFQGYDKDKVSELLKVIRDKVSISSQFRLFIS